MLEQYQENLDANAFVKTIMEREHLPRTKAMAYCRKKIPKESYFQDKIKKAIKKRYPDAFVRKIAQGSYSEGGTPDILVVWHGHYFGFEVKRPLVGEPSALQEACIRQIRKAGGTAEIISWAEQAFQIMDGWAEDDTEKFAKDFFQTLDGLSGGRPMDDLLDGKREED